MITKEQLKSKAEEFANMLKEFEKQSNTVHGDEEALENITNFILCSLPRNYTYVEWYSRSEIDNMIFQITEKDVKPEFLDLVMDSLWDRNSSFMDSESMIEVVNDIVEDNSCE